MNRQDFSKTYKEYQKNYSEVSVNCGHRFVDVTVK